MIFSGKQGNSISTLTTLIVGQHYRNHLRDYCNLCETLYPSPIPQNLCAFEKGRLAPVRCDPRLYLELGHFLSSGHLLLNLHVHSP